MTYIFLNFPCLSWFQPGFNRRIKCAICWRKTTSTITTSCRHVFCVGCLVTSLLHSDLCPYCRHTFTIEEKLEAQILETVHNHHVKLQESFHGAVRNVSVDVEAKEPIESSKFSVGCPLCPAFYQVHMQKRKPSHGGHFVLSSYIRHLQISHGARRQ